MAELNTVARPYTKAAFEYALDKGNLDQWSAMLSVAAQAATDSEMARVLGNPALTSEQKAELVIAVAEKQLDEAGKNFIFLLAENSRLALLPEIFAQFEKLKANQNRSVDLSVTTAFDLTEPQQQKLTQALGKKLGRDVNLTAETDQTILGGVIIRNDDLVIDGSVRARIAKLAEAMNS